jgi:hypothetical protein
MAILSGHSSCTGNAISGCDKSIVTFAYLVIGVAFGTVIFTFLLVRSRRRPRHQHLEEQPQEFTVDKEGWETKTKD